MDPRRYSMIPCTVDTMSIVKINAISVPEGAGAELEKRFEARKNAVDSAPGFEGFELLRPVKGDDRYFVVTRWADEASYEAWRDSDPHTKAGSGQACSRRRWRAHWWEEARCYRRRPS